MTSCGHGASRARWDRGRAKVAPAPAHRIRIGSRRRTSRLRGELVLDPQRRPGKLLRSRGVRGIRNGPGVHETLRVLPVRIANYQRAEHPVPRGFAMARPEPGTPRFSVRRSKPSKWAKSLEVSQFRPGDRDHPMFAVCRYLSPFVGIGLRPRLGTRAQTWDRAVRAASVPELERGFRHAGYVGRSPLARVGRQRALLREAGYERGVGADALRLGWLARLKDSSACLAARDPLRAAAAFSPGCAGVHRGAPGARNGRCASTRGVESRTTALAC